ncbi:C40 family peptidase [Tomitella biformata]|uniref:C40 family peptidase n=1 Tax=Tomitella biformata TaxID=630403 RepID=UPI0005702D19|nr:C40 family peptidase [Tomitella biformata]
MVPSLADPAPAPQGEPAPAVEAPTAPGVPGPDAPAPDAPLAEPANPGDAVAQLIDLSRKVEQNNQKFLAGQQQVDELVRAQQDADARRDAAQAVVDEAAGRVTQYQSTANAVALANYKGVRTNGLYAVMTSDSPQQLLDQMSAYGRINADTKARMTAFTDAVSDATAARAQATEAMDAATLATVGAEEAQGALSRERDGLTQQIDHVRNIYAEMTGADRAALAGPLFPEGFDLGSLGDGTGLGYAALQVALTRIGTPYVWGATGPDSFDCSGLVQWAYKQVGINTPRTALQQSLGGTPVEQKDILPGDVVTFYGDVSHVGIYAGNGMMVHASTFGVPVKVQEISAFPIHNIRRY